MSKSAAVLALLLGAAVGFAAGRLWPAAAHVAPEPSASDAAIPAAEIRERASAILGGPDPLARMFELSALLTEVGPDAVAPLLEAFELAPLDGGDPELVLFATWWAGFDPEAAYAWTSEDWRARFGSVLAAVFRGWGRVDPQAAFRRANTIAFPVQRQLTVDATFAGWDESGGEGLMEFLQSLGGSDQQRIAEIVARRRVVTLGAEGAIAWLETFPNPTFRDMMALRVAAAGAGVHDAAPRVAAWAEPKIAAAGRPTGLPRRIGTRWITHDPEAAMVWLASLPAGPDRDDGVAESYRDWLRRNPAAAIAWIDELELARWNEPALAIDARRRAGEHPAETLALVGRFTDPALRESTTVVVGRIWAEDDPDAAAAWFAASDWPEEVQKRALAVGTTPRRERIQSEAAARARAEAEARAKGEAAVRDAAGDEGA